MIDPAGLPDLSPGQKPVRVLFFGTPDFALPSLDALLGWAGSEVAAVFTQPDRPCGRGRSCAPSPVKVRALEQGLPVFQPEKLTPEVIRDIAGLHPDLLVVVAYGLILPQALLDLPAFGALNVHASLLPKYRGAAPIQRAIIDGEQITGVTIMRMVRALDAGPILAQRAMAVGIDDTARTLHDDLADLGATLLIQVLAGLRQGKTLCLEQDHARATYAAKLTKEDGRIDWNRDALAVHAHIRGVTPWPGAFFDWQGPEGETIRLNVFPGRIGEPLDPPVPPATPVPPGTMLGRRGEMLAIACADREYLASAVQPASGKRMNAREFWCGYLHRCS